MPAERDQLSIKSCPSFDDKLLSWLRSEGEYLDPDGNEISLKMLPAKNLSSLQVYDCVDFTTPALVDVIRFREDSHTTFQELEEVDSYKPRIDSLSIRGRGPALTPEAMDWFSSNEGSIDVTWETWDDEGEPHQLSLGV